MREKSWSISEVPTPQFRAWRDARPMCFASDHWAAVLRSLGAIPRFAWSMEKGFGSLVACFRRGPLRIGVCGLPVAGRAWDQMKARERARQLDALRTSLRMDIIRLNVCMQPAATNSSTGVRPEAWIADLAGWQIGASKRRRKDIAMARRTGRALTVTNGMSATFAHELYRQTLQRHGGSARYGIRYFSEIADAGSTDGSLRAFTAWAPHDTPCGFAVLAMHDQVAYYLHGGATEVGRQCSASDLLLSRMIDEARQAGCLRFSHLASPWTQPGLLAFKEKWADSKGLSVTEDVAGGFLGRMAVWGLKVRAKADVARGREWMEAVL